MATPEYDPVSVSQHNLPHHLQQSNSSGDFMQQNSHHVLNERALFGSFSTPDDYPPHAPVSFSNSNLTPAAIFKSSNLPFSSNGGLRQRTSDYSSSQSKAQPDGLQTIFKRHKPLIPVTLTLEQVMEYESAFKQFDINGDGVISTDELQYLLITVGLKPSESEVMIMIESVDMDDNGVLSICEFLQLMSKQHKPFITPKSQFEAVFRTFDYDNDGQLSRIEFKQALFSIGQRCSEDELERLMMNLDRNMDGRISKKEFLSVFMTTQFLRLGDSP